MTLKHSLSRIRIGWFGIGLLMLVTLLLWAISAVADVSASGTQSQAAAGCSPVAGTLITNPSFENGTSHWSFYTNGNGNLNTTTNAYDCDSAVALNLISSGSNVQFYQSGISLQANTAYTLTFAAYSTTGADFDVELLKHSSPYTNYGLKQTVDVGNGWQLYTIPFTTSGFSGTANNARFRFRFFGVNNSTFYIDAVNLVQGSGAPTPTTMPTATPVGPTATATATNLPAATPTSTATATPTSVAPTATNTTMATPTSLPSATPTTVPTATPSSITDPVVNSLNDPGDGVCDAAECTLREAVAAATEGSTIIFEPGLSGTIVFTEGAINVADSSTHGLTIEGPGSDVITLSGAGQQSTDDGFFSTGNNAGNARLNVSGFTMTNNTGAAVSASNGFVSVERSVIKDTYSAGSASMYGGVSFVETNISNVEYGIGAIYDSYIDFESSTITGVTGDEAAISSEEHVWVTITNSTISGNASGGVEGNYGDRIQIYSSTITDNGDFGFLPGDGGATVHNSIIANQQSGADDCIGAVDKFNPEYGGDNPFEIDYSLDSDGSCFVQNPSNPTNITAADAKLISLRDNGGPTLTHGIRIGSAAFDSGDCGTLTVDQRGKPRPKGAACDMGSFERRPY